MNRRQSQEKEKTLGLLTGHRSASIIVARAIAAKGVSMHLIRKYTVVVAVITMLGAISAGITQPMPLRTPPEALMEIEKATLQGDRFVVHVPEDYPTIQAAIDAIVGGGIILIGPGTYQENLRITKSVHIVGAGQEQVNVRALYEQWPTIYIEATAPIQVSFSGFTIGDPTRPLEQLPPPAPTQLHYPMLPVGIQIQGPVQASLRNLIVGGQPVAGIWIGSIPPLREPRLSPHVVLAEVQLIRNSGGLVTLGGHTTILRSAIRENQIGIARWLWEQEEFILYKSTLSGNSLTALVLSSFFAGVMGDIEENEIVGNGNGIAMAAQEPGGRVRISNNRVSQNAGYGVAILHPECLDLKPLFLLFEEQSAPLQIVGQQNELRDNGQDLCPPDYPWPPGFRK